ncbi:MAG: DUF309 domain-containing protein [Desulfobulbia bacterium]
MRIQVFNPFEDRLSRDIRNDLSESILKVLSQRSISPALEVAESYYSRGIASIYREYIDIRLARFQNVLAELPREATLLQTATLLWDSGLYFEVHEVLEPEWMTASGDNKLLLQALIRAAGVYINLELGYRERAAKISAKALPILKEFSKDIGQDLDADALVKSLELLSVTPPVLAKRR